MELILTKPVEHLGHRGQLVKVADGYARNFLLPQGLAMVATAGAKKQALALARAEQRKEQVRRDSASSERDKVHGKNITVRARATAAGKLYGSVTAKDICEALRQTHGVVVAAERCRLDEHIRDIGVHTVRFGFYHDIAAEVQVTVKALEETAPAPTPPTDEAPAQAEPEVVKRAPKPKPIITSSAVDERE